MANPKENKIEIPHDMRNVFIIVELDAKAGKLLKKVVATKEEFKPLRKMGIVESQQAFYEARKEKFKTLGTYSDNMVLVLPKEKEAVAKNDPGITVLMPDSLHGQIDKAHFELYKDNAITVRNESSREFSVLNVGQFPKSPRVMVNSALHVDAGKVTAFTQIDGRWAAGLARDPEYVVLDNNKKTAVVRASTRMQPYVSPVATDKKKPDAVGIYKLHFNGANPVADAKPFISAGKDAEVIIKGPGQFGLPFEFKGDSIAGAVDAFKEYRDGIVNGKNSTYIDDMVKFANPGFDPQKQIMPAKYTLLGLKTHDLEYDKDGKAKPLKPEATILKDYDELKKRKISALPVDDVLKTARDAVAFAPIANASGLALAGPRLPGEIKR